MVLLKHPLYSFGLSRKSRFTIRTMQVHSPQLLLSLLGTVRAQFQDSLIAVEQRGAQQVLAWLALKEDHQETRDRLAAALWPDKDTTKARSNLRQALFQLRKLMDQIGFQGLNTTRASVALVAGSFKTDLDELLEKIKSGQPLPARLERTPPLPQALLADLTGVSDIFSDWVVAQRGELDTQLRVVLLAALESSCDNPRSQSLARALLCLNPGDEQACRTLMNLFVMAGDIGQALQQYNSLWTYLADEYDVEPSESTQQLAISIKIGEQTADDGNTSVVAESSAPSFITPQKYTAVPVVAPPDIETLYALGESAMPVVLWLEIARSDTPETDSVIEKGWQAFLQQMAQINEQSDDVGVLQENGSRLVLSYSDSRRAVQAAFAIQQRVFDWHKNKQQQNQFCVRIVLDKYAETMAHNVSQFAIAKLICAHDPVGVVASAEVVEQIIPTLDAEIDDLGNFELELGKSTLRLYQLSPANQSRFKLPVLSAGNLLPTIAVIPFSARSVNKEHFVVGDILADEVIASLSVSPDINIISRLSTSVFRDRRMSTREIGNHLNANYIISGVYFVFSDNITLDVELADANSSQVVWSERLRGRLGDFMAGNDGITESLINAILSAVMRTELQRAFSAPLPSLESYTLLVAAVALMHRNSEKAFYVSRKMLDALIERTGHISAPHAWLGKWYVLRAQQGWTQDPMKDGLRALECTKRALDNNPVSALAYTINGIVQTNLLKNLDEGERLYRTALQQNPNESMAWLLKGTLHAFKGEGSLAVSNTQKALNLTPLDPLRYFYLSLSATAALANNDFDTAKTMATQSLRLNRTHTSTLRVLAIAQWNLGRKDNARETVRELLQLEPELTISDWLRRSPSAPYSIGSEWAKAMRGAGVPD